MRRTGSPQLRAMSLALLAQGETVPRRGMTTNSVAASSLAAARPASGAADGGASSACSRACAAGSRAASQATQ